MKLTKAPDITARDGRVAVSHTFPLPSYGKFVRNGQVSQVIEGRLVGEQDLERP